MRSYNNKNTTSNLKDPTHKAFSLNIDAIQHFKVRLLSSIKYALTSTFHSSFTLPKTVSTKKLLNEPTSKNENKANDEATVFIQTFPEEGRPGHTSAYVVGPHNETFSTSLFPSSKLNRHLLQAYLNIPVQGFNTKGPLSDVRYEQAPAYSILEIKAPYHLLKEAQEKYLADLQTNVYFSLKYNSTKNIFKIFLQNKVEAGGFDPITRTYPTNDDLLVGSPKEDVHFINCTKAVENLLIHARFFKEARDENRSLTPKAFQAELVALGAIERVNDLDKLPAQLKESQLKGIEIAKNRPMSTRETMESFRQNLSVLG